MDGTGLAPLSMEFSRQEYCSGLLFPSILHLLSLWVTMLRDPPPDHNIHTSFHPSMFSLVSLGPVCHLISCGERPSWGNLCCRRDKGVFLSPDASLVKTIALKDLKLALFLGKNMSQITWPCMRWLWLWPTTTSDWAWELHDRAQHQVWEVSPSGLICMEELLSLSEASQIPWASQPSGNQPYRPRGARAQQGGRDLTVHCHSCCARRWSLPSVSLHFTASESPSAC